MRVAVFVSAALVAIGAGVGAQTTGGTPAAPLTPATAAARLDQHLKRWETEMRKVTSLSAAITRFDKDTTFKTTTKFTGGAYYTRSGSGPTAFNLALLELREEGKTTIAEKFVCTGVKLYQYSPAQKEIRVYDVQAPTAGRVSDDSFLGFLFGMRAEEAKTRYTLTMAKEDTWYVYVDVIPKSAADKDDFSRARLVLNRDTFLPRQLWFQHKNGSETTWDIPRLQSGAAIDRRMFDAPAIPAGWKLVPINRGPAGGAAPPAPPGGAGGVPGGPAGTVPPRVIRPSGGPG